MARRFLKQHAHGHKRTTPGPKRTVGSRQTVSFRCPEHVSEAVRSIANKRQASMSSVINEAILACWDRLQAGEDILPDWTIPTGFCKWKQSPKRFATVQETRTKLGDLYVAWDLPQSQAVVKAIVAHYNLS